jgi:hypothetical protein
MGLSGDRKGLTGGGGGGLVAVVVLVLTTVLATLFEAITRLVDGVGAVAI